MSNKREVTKKVARFVVGWSTAWAVGNIVHNNVTPDNKFRKAEAVVTGVVVGSLVSDLAEDHVASKIDDIFDLFDGTKDPDVRLNIAV